MFRAPPFNITCCKELAAADSEELTARLEQHHATGAAPRLPYLPDEDTVEAWAAACRSDELDEMMLAVVGGDDAVLDALELVHIALPQDVALWASMPQTLLDTMRRELPEERWAAVEGRVTVEAIAEWAARAQRFAETVDWLRFWVTN